MTKRAFLAAVTLALVLAATGCGGDDEGGGGGAQAGPPSEPVTIRMGWGIPAEEIKYVMQANPRLAPNMGTWYRMEWNQFAGTALGVQGLAAETLDCATVGSLSVANGLDQGADIVITGEFIEERPPNFSTAWMVRKDSGIDAVADLRGKTVGTSAVGGSTDYVQDFYIREKGGLQAGRDYKKVELPFAQQQEALLSGRIDVGIFPQPFFGRINATGDVKTLFRLTDAQNPFVQLLNGCRRSFLEDNPEVMRRFLQDWVAVARYVKDPANRDAVIQASSKATKIPAEVLDRFLLTRRDFFRPADGAVDVPALQQTWDFFRRQGGIKTDLRVQDHVTPQFSAVG